MASRRNGFSKDLRRYREFLIGGYRNGAAGSKQWLNGWFGDNPDAVESNPWGKSLLPGPRC